MTTQQSSDDANQKLRDEAATLQAELDALAADINGTLPAMQKHAEEAEASLTADIEALDKEVKAMDKELTAAEKDAQKHMNIVDDIEEAQ